MKRVLLAMSGGVDSAVSAILLKEKDYQVIGVTMKIWPKEYCTEEKERSCCSLKDISDAKKVCAELSIPHYVLNFEEIFKDKVIDYFVREYLDGRTPNPCIICNEKIKFGALMDKAKELECSFIATGHYARIVKSDEYELRESIDKTKDQSYALFSIKKEYLGNILFPVGDSKKKDIKKKAEGLGMDLHKKAESQEICFVRGDSYIDFIKEYASIKSKEGNIIDKEGNILGKHNGYWNFTIGQRRGLGIAYKEPLYVVNIIPKDNTVVVGIIDEVKRDRFFVDDINWLKKKTADFEALVKIRYNHKKKKAKIHIIDDDSAEVLFFEPQEAITPGQAAVFYEDDLILGGGWIK